MVAVRYAVLAAQVVWLGGMVVLGLIVAPSAFRVLPAANPHDGRVLAALLFADVLWQFHIVAYLCGAVGVIGLFIMKFVGPPPTAFVVRVALLGAMLASAVYTGVPVSRELSEIQASVPGPISTLAESDARRLRFDVLHRTSTACMALNVGLGLFSLLWYARE
jgi:hypothetical protein